MRVPVACFYRDAFVTRLQQDVLPASSCNGVNVMCSGRLIKVTAQCKPVEAPHFRSIVSKATRGRLLSGKKKLGHITKFEQFQANLSMGEARAACREQYGKDRNLHTNSACLEGVAHAAYFLKKKGF
jgi:hypothetical protein